jgi:hypothetical protein
VSPESGAAGDDAGGCWSSSLLDGAEKDLEWARERGGCREEACRSDTSTPERSANEAATTKTCIDSLREDRPGRPGARFSRPRMGED